MKPVIIETDNGKIRGKCVGVNPGGSIIIIIVIIIIIIIVQTGQGKVAVPDETLLLDA